MFSGSSHLSNRQQHDLFPPPKKQLHRFMVQFPKPPPILVQTGHALSQFPPRPIPPARIENAKHSPGPKRTGKQPGYSRDVQRAFNQLPLSKNAGLDKNEYLTIESPPFLKEGRCRTLSAEAGVGFSLPARRLQCRGGIYFLLAFSIRLPATSMIRPRGEILLKKAFSWLILPGTTDLLRRNIARNPTLAT